MPTQDVTIDIWLASHINLTEVARQKIESTLGQKFHIHYPTGKLAGEQVVWANARGFSGTKAEVDNVWKELNQVIYLAFQDQVTNINSVSATLNATITR